MTDYPVATGVDDFTIRFTDGSGTTTDYTATTLLASFSRVLAPYFTDSAYMECNTSAIPDADVISAATFYFYASAYTISKGVTKTYILWMGVGGSAVIIKTGTFVSAGWINEILTASELLLIEKAGLTQFRVSVDDPGALKSRSMTITALESGTNTAYLSVTHAPASSAYYNISICTT